MPEPLQSILEHFCPPVILTAYDAGQAILNIYHGNDFDVQLKADSSPLTAADKAAHKLIMERLQMLWDYPVLSEEGKEIPYETRSAWQTYWLVDPLDGTKEFIKRNGEFTVNIALIHDGKPVYGVVFAPALNLFYVGAQGHGAFRFKQGDDFADRAELAEKLHDIRDHFQPIPCPRPQGEHQLRVVASRSHCNVETTDFIERLEEMRGPAKLVSIGSSLKICLVADGSADVYPRIAPTMHWDTAAAQAVLEATGGCLVQWDDHEPLRYNRSSLVNPYFVAYAHDWE
ncbi:MAG: 3'(2'),5'-bisphosphate nucleotidase CysQ [Victivallales bacterium]|nr:3'(2'),5'-bisphosphate nucleotidase CysQ [Victivallales bacterium]